MFLTKQTVLMRSTSVSSSQRQLADHDDNKDASFELIHGAERDTHSPNGWQDYKKLVSLFSFDARQGNKPRDDIGNLLHKGIAMGALKMAESP